MHLHLGTSQILYSVVSSAWSSGYKSSLGFTDTSPGSVSRWSGHVISKSSAKQDSFIIFNFSRMEGQIVPVDKSDRQKVPITTNFTNFIWNMWIQRNSIFHCCVLISKKVKAMQVNINCSRCKTFSCITSRALSVVVSVRRKWTDTQGCT